MPKRGTDGCRAVLPELIFVQARQSPQRILDVFARVLTRHERKSAGQNRHGFKSRQPKKIKCNEFKKGKYNPAFFRLLVFEFKVITTFAAFNKISHLLLLFCEFAEVKILYHISI